MKKYAITLSIETVLVALLAWSKDILEQTAMVNIFHILCDCFFVVGVVVTGIGALVFVSNEGVFDGISYGLRAFANIFRKEVNRNMESYYDYRTRRSENKFDFVFLLICGLIFLAIAVAMLMFYSKYSISSV